MELGKIQKEWLQSLREHPERQLIGWLGTRLSANSDEYQACCLGEYGIVCANNGIGKVGWYMRHLEDNEESLNSLQDSYKSMGLNSHRGELKKEINRGGKTYSSLADMNDGGFTWPEIADYVEANPDNVFTKSL